jgi:hypothetical protein
MQTWQQMWARTARVKKLKELKCNDTPFLKAVWFY